MQAYLTENKKHLKQNEKKNVYSIHFNISGFTLGTVNILKRLAAAILVAF